MPALSLNGWDLPPLLDGASQEPEIGEDAGASVSGDMLRQRRYIKRKWALKFGILDTAQKQDLYGLVQGLSDHWDFDSTGTDWQWSEGGIGLASGTATQTTSYHKYGTGSLDVGSSNLPHFDARITGGWTLLGWRRVLGVWNHYALTSTGDKYKDGVAYGGAIQGLTVSGGQIVLGYSGMSQTWDDLVLLRWAASAELIAAIYGAGVAFRGPSVWATGDLLESDSGGLLVTFDAPKSEYKPASDLYGQIVSTSMRER